MRDGYRLAYSGSGGHYTSAPMDENEALLEALLGAETGMIWPLALKGADGGPAFAPDLVVEARLRFGSVADGGRAAAE